MRLRTLIPVLPLLLGLSGCGGGGAGMEPDTGPDQQVGPMTVSGGARALAPAVTSGGATLYAMTGTINSAKMLDASPTIAETEVFFVAARGTGYSLMASTPEGDGLRVLAPITATVVRKIQVIGDSVYYVENVPAFALKRVKIAGGTPSTVRANISAFSPNLSGSKIYGYQVPSGSWPNGRMVSFNPDGTGTTHMFATSFSFLGPYYFPGLLSDGSLVLVDNQGSSFTLYRAYSPAGLPRSSYSHGNSIDSVGMENGSDHVFHRSSGFFERMLAAGQDDWPRDFPSVVNRYDNGLAISPGGTHYAFSNTGTNTSGVFVHEPGNVAGKKIYSQRALAVGWGPLVTQREFIGTGLPFTAAGAFLFSERGDVLPAVVWADATTRNTITLTKVSADGGQNVVYRLNCDQVTKISFSNSLNYLPVAVPGAGEAGVKGAFISFNAETGRVASISTFKGTVNATSVNGVLKVSGLEAVFHSDGSTQQSPGLIEFK